MANGRAGGVFDAYARYYDVLYKDKDYEAEAAYVAGLIRRHAPQARTILELGCGSGGHAAFLASMGFTVHGIDMSAAMVARAEERRAASTTDVSARVSFAVGDARTARAGGPYDAVVSLFNVIGYQTSDADLAAMLDTAAAHLRTGGVFLFDFWYGPAVEADPPIVRVKRFEDETIKVTRIGEPVIHPDRHVIDVAFTLFIETRATGDLRRVEESHAVRYIFPAEFEEHHGGDFRDLGSYAWMTDEPPHDRSWNAVQLFRRT